MKLQTLTSTIILAALPILSAKAETVYILSSLDQIISFDSATPGNILSAHSITGLTTGESLLGLDARPADGMLYALGSSSRLYSINPATGGATQVGSGQFSPLLNGSTFGFDLNPTVDRFRVTTDLDQNLRINPITGGVTATDGTLAYAAGDSRFGQSPNINGVAYNNNFPGALTTTLYGIDSLQNTLVTIGTPSPNDGTVHTIGALGIDVSRFNGFDISGVSGIGYIVSPAASSDPAANLYMVNLANGGVTLVGKIGGLDADYLVRGLTVFAPVPEPGISALLAVGGSFGFLLWRRQRSRK